MFFSQHCLSIPTEHLTYDIFVQTDLDDNNCTDSSMLTIVVPTASLKNVQLLLIIAVQTAPDDSLYKKKTNTFFQPVDIEANTASIFQT